MPEPEPTRLSLQRSRTPVRRIALASIAVLVPLVPIVVGLMLSRGPSSASAAQATTSTAAAFTPVGRPPVAHRGGSIAPPGTGAIVGLVTHRTDMHRSIGGPVFAHVSTKTDFNSPTFVLVHRVAGHWLGVISTAAGNNRIGWIRASAVSLTRVHWSLHAVLDRNELLVSHNGRVVRRFSIATGKPSAPTPPGRFEVTDRLRTGDDTGPYGCCIVALSAQAPHAISDWDGGNRIAIHSTPETSSIGHPVSHGCMRLTLAEGRWLLAHIPLGTPATISSA